jgi:hypothetical protein
VAQKQSRVVTIEGTNIVATNDGETVTIGEEGVATLTFPANEDTVADLVWLVTGNKRRVPRKANATKPKSNGSKSAPKEPAVA